MLGVVLVVLIRTGQVGYQNLHKKQTNKQTKNKTKNRPTKLCYAFVHSAYGLELMMGTFRHAALLLIRFCIMHF